MKQRSYGAPLILVSLGLALSGAGAFAQSEPPQPNPQHVKRLPGVAATTSKPRNPDEDLTREEQEHGQATSRDGGRDPDAGLTNETTPRR